jgi:beta-glucosidase
MDHPVHDIEYKEGVFVGYRWYEYKEIEPLYPFGHGLSYSTFEYSNINTNKNDFNIGDDVLVKVDISNKSNISGKEIVQLYVKDVKSSVERPLKELKDFRKVDLKSGENKTIYFTLTGRDFSFWDEESSSWKIELGNFEIMIGSSSNNIYQSVTISFY